MLLFKIIKINIIIKKEGDMGNPTTVLLCEKSMRLACKGLDHTREQVGAPLLLSENGPHPRFCLSDCPSMTPLFSALRDPKAMVPRKLNFPGNPTLGKREAKAQGPKEELS